MRNSHQTKLDSCTVDISWSEWRKKLGMPRKSRFFQNVNTVAPEFSGLSPHYFNTRHFTPSHRETHALFSSFELDSRTHFGHVPKSEWSPWPKVWTLEQHLRLHSCSDQDFLVLSENQVETRQHCFCPGHRTQAQNSIKKMLLPTFLIQHFRNPVTEAFKHRTG